MRISSNNPCIFLCVSPICYYIHTSTRYNILINIKALLFVRKNVGIIKNTINVLEIIINLPDYAT